MGVRKDQKGLAPAEKSAFVNAVLALKQKPSQLHPGDPNRGRYDDYVEVHLNAMMQMMMGRPSWGHGGPAFFAWHRKLLLEFEKDLQAINPTANLPYWDWTNSNSTTGPPWTGDFMGGNGRASDGQVTDGPFAGWTLRVLDNPGDPTRLTRRFGSDPTARKLPTAKAVKAVRATVPYDSAPWDGTVPMNTSFRNSLELRIHNLVHRWVGGAMVAMASPNDPVFWLHHCNIDRLWDVWQRQHPQAAHYLPVSGAPAGHNLNDAMIFKDPNDPAARAPWPGSTTPASVIDHHALGYSYDTEPAPVVQPFVAALSPGMREIRERLHHFPLETEIRALSKRGTGRQAVGVSPKKKRKSRRRL